MDPNAREFTADFWPRKLNLCLTDSRSLAACAVSASRDEFHGKESTERREFDYRIRLSFVRRASAAEALRTDF